MKRDEAFNILTSIIRDVYGIASLNNYSSINSFNATTEDNVEFFKQFSERFNVDMTVFQYYDYFDDDQFFLVGLLRLFYKPFKKGKKKAEVTIDHLIDVALSRRWSNPPS